MRTLRGLLLAGLSGVCVAACSDDDDDGGPSVLVADLEGASAVALRELSETQLIQPFVGTQTSHSRRKTASASMEPMGPGSR